MTNIGVGGLYNSHSVMISKTYYHFVLTSDREMTESEDYNARKVPFSTISLVARA